MKRIKYKRAVAFLLGCILAFSPCVAQNHHIFSIISRADGRAATVNATNLNVRTGPGTSYQAVTKLSHGMPVTVLGEQTGTDGKQWYQIRFAGGGGTEATGYVSAQYIRFPAAVAADSDFERYMASQGFPESYKPGLRELHARYPQWTFTAFKTNLDWNTVISNESVIGRNLVARNNVSSWKSTAAGAYDWDTGTWPGFDGNSWVQASEDIIKYYMDPRNFLNDKYIFQFMKQTYDGSFQTREGLESMVAGTFLAGVSAGGSSADSGNPASPDGSSGSAAPGSSNSSGNTSSGGSEPGGSSSGNGPALGPGAAGGTQGTEATAAPPISPVASVSTHEVERVMTAYGPGMEAGSTGSSSGVPGSEENKTAPSTGTVSGSSAYIDMIMNAAVQSGVSPYILASMILQEQGSQGNGRSISGTVSGYQGYYNFFNIEAYQSGSMGAVERGLWWASQSGSYGRPWNSRERSILGGALWYGDNYVKKGQNTLYLKKFNVQGSNLYKHQYMTNVLAAAAEGLALAKITSLKTTALEFSIPVYNNMPESPCVKPTLDGSPNNKLSGLGVEGFTLTPTFNRDTESYDLIVDPSVTSVAVSASAIDSKAVVGGTGNVSLQSGNNDITVSVKAENGSMRNYVIHVVRQSGGPVYCGSSGNGSGAGNGNAPGSSGTAGNENTHAPGSGGNSGNGSSGSSTGPVAPGMGNVSGFGTENNPSSLVGPDGSVLPPVGSASPDGNGSSGSLPAGSTGAAGNANTGNAPAETVSDGYEAVGAGTTAAVLAAGIVSAGRGTAAKVYQASGTEVSGAVATGQIVQIFGADGAPGARFEIVVKGDNNGDGKLNILDVLRAQRHILGMETMTGANAEATDVNGNRKIDIMDILLMQKDILGLQKLN